MKSLSLLLVLLFVLLASNNFSIVYLCEAVKLRHGERVKMSNIDSMRSDSQGDVIAPPNCAGVFETESSILFRPAVIEASCDPNICYVTRPIDWQLSQQMYYNISGPNGQDNLFIASGSTNLESDDSSCYEDAYEPANITLAVSGLVYNYNFVVFNEINYNVTRTFNHLDSAALYINGELVASISADSSTVSQSQTIGCLSPFTCEFFNNENPTSAYIGNDYIRFYYEVPTFVILLSQLNNTILDKCASSMMYTNGEIAMCMTGDNPIGPCFRNDLSSSVIYMDAPNSFGPYDPIMCTTSTSAPTPSHTQTLTPIPTSKPKGKPKPHH